MGKNQDLHDVCKCDQSLLKLHVVLLLSPFLMPKQEVHSLKDTCLSLSASHSWKKREVQCSMGTSGTRSGANSEWDRNLQERSTLIIEVCSKVQFQHLLEMCK